MIHPEGRRSKKSFRESLDVYLPLSLSHVHAHVAQVHARLAADNPSERSEAILLIIVIDTSLNALNDS